MSSVKSGALRLAALAGVAMAGVLFAPVAKAQCSAGPRNFATVGGGGTTDKVRILPGSSRGGVTGALGSEIGRFWQSSNSAFGHNFVPGDADFRMAGDRCPSQGATQVGGGWWQVSNTTKRGISGWVSGVGCEAETCPVGDMTVIVEDYGPTGPPGLNDTAHFIGFRVDETPGGQRYWDLAKVAPPETDLLFIEYPVPTVTSSFKQGTDRVVTLNFANVSFHVHGQTGTGPLPATDIVASYDLMVHTGDTDPGRLRYAGNCEAPNPGGRCWTLVQKTPFSGFGPEGVVAVIPCESVTKDSFVALGVSFKGGVGPDVPSTLVGRSLQIECDPNLADPPKPKPGRSRIDARPRPESRTRSPR
jgi:hypothetical protein